jgi:hypothetical protein
MSENSNRNAGVRIVGNFTDQAISLVEGQTGQEVPLKTGRSVNTGIHVVADFRDQAQSLPREC